MGVITCLGCNTQISSDVDACPRCGKSSASQLQNALREARSVATIVKPKRKGWGLGTKLGLCFIAGLVAVVATGQGAALFAFWLGGSLFFWVTHKKRDGISPSRAQLSRLGGFNATVDQHLPSGDAIAIDAAGKRLAILSAGQLDVFDYGGVVAAEVCRNGDSITATNRGSQAIGGAVGLALLGPLGLLLGGLTGSKRTVERVSRLSLRVHVRDIARPTREVVWYDGNPIKDEAAIRAISDGIEDWFNRIKLITNG